MNILLVDDSEVGQFLIGHFLIFNGHRVDTAGDGVQAWELLQNRSFDLILSDVLMPRLDGFELCYLVKSNGHTRGIPFIFFSGEYLTPQDQAFALRLGAARYIFMTEDPVQFVRELEIVLATPREAFPPPPMRPMLDERNYLREYKERLFHQLTEKIGELQKTSEQWIEERQAAQRLRELDRLKNDFIAMLSHELRTPLTAIIGYCDLLQGKEQAHLTEEEWGFVPIINDKARHLLEMINRLLEFARLRSQHLSVQLGSIDLGEVIGRALSSVSPQAVRKSLTLASNLPDPVPGLWTDPQLLQQVLIILLDNAVKFTPPGGCVTVAASADAETVTVGVRDTGIGIAPADQATIFEPFHQVEAIRQRRYNGVGLGLAIARQLVTSMGGRLEVDSQPQQGSRFSVVLPLHSAG